MIPRPESGGIGTPTTGAGLTVRTIGTLAVPGDRMANQVSRIGGPRGDRGDPNPPEGRGDTRL